MKKFLIPIGFFAALGLLFYYALSQMESGELSPRRIPSPLINKPFPDFTLPVLRDPDRQVSSAELRGRVYLLNVWASWCVACRIEHPVLMEIAKQDIVPIIGLDYKDKRVDGLAWLAEHGDPYKMSLVDNNGRVGIDLGVYGVPETFLVDKQGILRYKHIGPITPDILRNTVLPKIKELTETVGQAKAG
ncbi:MAG: DsbE family thiol:disulfide interchange protein [Acidiferrobacterales bacterium]